MVLRLPTKSCSSSALFSIVYYDMNVLKFMSRLVELFLQTFYPFSSTKWNTTNCSSTITTAATTTQVKAAPHKTMKLQQGLRCSSCNNIKNNNDENFNSIGKGEISMVMDRLGIEFDHLDDACSGFHGLDDVFSLFDDDDDDDEEENGRVLASLEDMVVKDAFDVFDKNKDGFIDHEELQIVLCSLGMQQGSQLELEECRRMISEFDDNGDGLIDFQEFLTLIHYSFSS